MNRWRHKPTGDIYERVGSERSAAGEPFVVMQSTDGARVRAHISPLALLTKDGDWEKLAEVQDAA